MAENKIIEKTKKIRWICNPVMCLIGIAVIFSAAICIRSVYGFLLDVFYVPVIICFTVNLIEKIDYLPVTAVLKILGKYSTGMWFFHAVFFSNYVCDWFQPILKLISWPPLMFVWLVVLSLAGAFVYQKFLDGFHTLACFIKRSF